MKFEFKYNNQEELEKDREKLDDLKYIITNNTIVIDDDCVIENCLAFIEVIIKLNLSHLDMGDKEIGALVRKLLIIHNKIILNEELEEV